MTKSDNYFMASAFNDLLKILRRFEKNLDNKVFNEKLFNELNISKTRFKKYIEMLSESDFISGVEIHEYINEDDFIDFSSARITINGLKFLAENTMLAKTYKTVKELSGIIKL